MKAFSIGFETATFDESDYARLVAGRLGVEHVVETLREQTLLEVLDPALDRLDEPLARSVVPADVPAVAPGGPPRQGRGRRRRRRRAVGRLPDLPRPPLRRALRPPAAPGCARGWCRTRDRSAAGRPPLPEPGVEAAPLHPALRRRSRAPPPALDVERRSARSGGGARAGPAARGRSRQRPGAPLGDARGDVQAPARRRRRLAEPDPRARLHHVHAGLGADQGRSRVDGARPRGAARRCSTTRWSTGRSRCRRATSCAAGAGKYLLKRAAKGSVPDAGDRPPQEGLRDPAGRAGWPGRCARASTR